MNRQAEDTRASDCECDERDGQDGAVRSRPLSTLSNSNDKSGAFLPDRWDEPLPKQVPLPPERHATFSTAPPCKPAATFAGRVLVCVTRVTSAGHSGSALAGFLSLLLLTCANYMLSPMRDAAALAIGVSHIPLLTFVSTLLALASSVPVGWLFEAPNPYRSGRRWRDRLGLTRGDTQGTSLALFYRCFALCLLGYALAFKLVEHLQHDSSFLSSHQHRSSFWLLQLVTLILRSNLGKWFYTAFFLVVHLMKLHSLSFMWGVTSDAMEYEEQAQLRQQKRTSSYLPVRRNSGSSASLATNSDGDKPTGDAAAAAGTNTSGKQSKARLKRLAFVGFGGTLGGILGSVIVSLAAHTLHLSGLLVVAAILLELTAELSIELGRIMLRHWEDEQIHNISNDDLVSLGSLSTAPLTPVSSTVPESAQNNSSGGNAGIHPTAISQSADCPEIVDSSMKRVSSHVTMSDSGLDISMKRVSSLGSMKRVASGNAINALRKANSESQNLHNMDGGSISSSGGDMKRNKNSGNSLVSQLDGATSNGSDANRGDVKAVAAAAQTYELEIDDNSFSQRLLRGVTTILRSRLLMAIFTYNALYATTSVLLSFQRAELVANRSSPRNNLNVETSSNVDSDTAFLARINMASSVAVFSLQASGLGALLANSCGQRGTLVLMPIIRLLGVLLLAWWHIAGDGQPPNLTLFLLIDEFTKVINFAVAKPVRESLWRGLSNEARYEAKPIVDTLANRWGGGSAAFLTSLLDRIMSILNVGENNGKTLFGFPPILILCSISAAWWAMVSVDVGNIRHRIDLELKKQQ